MTAVCQIKLKVVPNASKSEILGWQGDTLRVKVQASPEDGKANEAVINILAATLSISRRSVLLLHGAKSRDKTVKIEGLTIEAVKERLEKTD